MRAIMMVVATMAEEAMMAKTRLREFSGLYSDEMLQR
jgi:hypothetical protein